MSSEAPTYTPDISVTTAQPDQLPRVLYDELIRISAVLQVLQLGRLEPIHVAPAKYRDGDVRLALSPLDLGAGDGVYVRYGGAWNKL